MTTFFRCHRRRRCPAPIAAATLLFGLSTLFSAVSVPAARAADWPVLAGGVTRSGVSEESVKTPLSLLWRYTAGPQSGNPCAPVVAGNLVYYAARGSVGGAGALFAVDPKTGERRWRFDLQGSNLFQTAPTVADGILYIGASNGSVYVLDANTGREVHPPFQTARSIESAPTVVDGTLYFGSDDGSFYAFDTQTSAPVWRTPYKAGDAINSAPIIANGYVFFTTNGNTIHGVKQATGLGRWSFRVPFRIQANAPVFADSTLYLPANQRLYAFQPTSGNVRWTRDLPNDILAAPAAEGGVVYCLSKNQQGDGAQLWAVRSNNGKDFWKKPANLDITPSAAPTISGDVIFVPTIKNVLYALSKEDGHLLWEYHVDPTASTASQYLPPATALTAPVAVANGAVYVLSDDGSLSAFRPDAPDASGPNISGSYPVAAQRVNGNPPFTLAAFISDPGSGVDPASVKLKLDGKEVTTDFDADRGLAYYQTKSSGSVVERSGLTPGRHTAILNVTDWRGNTTEETWSFIVDNSMAPATRTGAAPVAPKSSTAPRPGAGNPTGLPGAIGTPGGTTNGTNGNGRRGGGRRNRGGNGGTGNGNL